MTARDVIARALALSEAATDGPWYWRNSGNNVYLLGRQSRAVMTFERMGMQGAQPAFRGEDGLLYPAGKANLHAIPDALFMAKSRHLLPALAKALGDVLDLADRWEHGATRWADPLPVPVEVEQVRAAITAALSEVTP